LIAGDAMLLSGMNAIDVVERTVYILEDNPLFNAGRGSVFNHEGKNEMDAAIMNGVDLRAGAVAGIVNIKNPIRLARAVMDQSEHVLMCGPGAMEFARSINAEFCSDEYLFVEARHEQLKMAQRTGETILDHTPDDSSLPLPDGPLPYPDDKKFGTVGAVACDLQGNLAAATSTGGMTNKRFGRIGDSPIIGSGTYANNNTCAISCTGHGEFFLRAVVAYDVSCLMEYKGMSLQEACDEVVMRKLVDLGGEGGLIGVDKQCNISLSFNSDGMYRASIRAGEAPYIGIYS
jgi:L-asparaginase / beta-aspartyl-peptidase